MNDQKKVRVLVIDDTKLINQLLALILTSLDCEMAGVAESGEEGVKLFKQQRPDLTLLDITMPGMNGVDALRKIMKTDPYANVVMLTGVDNTVVAENCIALGAKDFIRKDIDPEELQQRLASAVQALRA